MPHVHVAATFGVVSVFVDDEQLFLSPDQATLVSADILDAVVGLGDALVDGMPVVVVTVGSTKLGMPLDVARNFAVQLATAADAAD